jgi:hypothetical protein
MNHGRDAHATFKAFSFAHPFARESAMSALSIAPLNMKTKFLPGEAVEGLVTWQLDQPAEAIELRLFWYTRGKGDTDAVVVDRQRLEAPKPQDRRQFRFILPEAPYSFSGKLISLIWAIEMVVEPSGLTERLEITVSPTGQEIQLSAGTPVGTAI